MSLRSILLVEVYSTALSRALAIEPGNDIALSFPRLDVGIFFFKISILRRGR